MLGFCPLASGSKGNAIYFGTEEIKILIDAGISMRLMEERLAEIGVAVSEIDVILSTHEHSDHIKGIETLSKKLGIPVYANSETAKGMVGKFTHQPAFKIFATGESFSLADLTITPFRIQHDTPDPVAFTISHRGAKFGFCTDLGFVTSVVKYHLQECDYLYIEANHQPSMVYASSRPEALKRRIMGPTGHLSNDECARLLTEVWSPRLQQVYLAHLSDECNDPSLAKKTIEEALQKVGSSIPVKIAHQEKVSDPVLFSRP